MGKQVRPATFKRRGWLQELESGTNPARKTHQIDWESPEFLKKIKQAVLTNAAYPNVVGSVEVVQTHLSTVFLTENFVFKFKKNIDLGFADFRTLRARRRFCHAELRLNSRLAPAVYLAVLPLRVNSGCYQFAAEGRVVDYTVVMKRLPAASMLDARLKAGLVTQKDMEALAQRLVRFHRGLRASASRAHYGGPAAWAYNWKENFEQVAPLLGKVLNQKDYQVLLESTLRFLLRNQQPLQERMHRGFIRNGHGDLRCEHICMTDPFQIIDCVEFSERFRYGDVANDLAFLLMDLTARNQLSLARELLQHTLRLSGDKGMLRVLPFYLCYRAFVRGKVLGMRLLNRNISFQERRIATRQARNYFKLAMVFHRQMQAPLLMIMAGTMGSGKSHLAERLAKKTGAELFQSDSVRKTLALEHAPNLLELSPRESFGAGLYSKDWIDRAYDALLEKAAVALAGGKSVILDATFSNKAHRIQAERLANQKEVNFLVAECRVPDSVALKRLRKRWQSGGSASDGRVELYQKQKSLFEPVQEISHERHLVVYTEPDASEVVKSILALPQVIFPDPLLGMKLT